MENLEQKTIGIFSYILQARKDYPYIFHNYTDEFPNIQNLMAYKPGTTPEFILRSEFKSYALHDALERNDETASQADAYLRAFNELSPAYAASNKLSENDVLSRIETVIESTKTWKGTGIYLELELGKASGILKAMAKEGLKSNYGKNLFKYIWAYHSSVARVDVTAEKRDAIGLLKEYIMACSTDCPFWNIIEYHSDK
jgi:hypothetical protein